MPGDDAGVGMAFGIHPGSALGQRGPPFGNPFLDLLLGPLLCWLVVLLVGPEIILRDKMAGKIVGILVAFTMAQPLCPGIIPVSQPLGHRQRAARFNVL